MNWTPRAPTIAPGEGFWIYTPAPMVWKQDFSNLVRSGTVRWAQGLGWEKINTHTY